MKSLTKSKTANFIFRAFLVAIIGLAGGVIFKSFFAELPKPIIPTGMSGFAMIVSTWLSAGGINLSVSIIYLIMNLILFAIALKFLGFEFLLLSGIGMGTYVLGMEFGFIGEVVKSVTNASGDVDMLLLCIVGSLIGGLVTGLAIKLGGSTGGSDVFGKLLNRVAPKIKTGTCILIFNAFVLILSIITGGLQTGLYALINSILSSIATDMVLDNTKKIVAFYIICDKAEEISNAIFMQYHRGVTKLDGQGMYTQKDKSVLMCLVPYDQSYKMREFVLKIESGAFVFSTPVSETMGEAKLFKKMRYGIKRIDNAFKVKTKKKYSRHSQIKSLKLNRVIKGYKKSFTKK